MTDFLENFLGDRYENEKERMENEIKKIVAENVRKQILNLCDCGKPKDHKYTLACVPF